MPIWIPEQVWKEQDVFIIGGGSSLKYFNWDNLKSELTIGCNSAFILGSEICKICVFGDLPWFGKFEKELKAYQGVLFTNVPQLLHSKIPWLWTLPRKNYGLHKAALGWNGNTGAVAVNLALLLGAKNVFLLGFDMALDEKGNPNWHDKVISKSKRLYNKKIISKFQRGFRQVAVDVPRVFPGRRIINVTDNSNLDVFPKVGFRKFWNERLGKEINYEK